MEVRNADQIVRLIGARCLKELMDSENISQRKLASRIGISPKTLRNYLRGDHSLSQFVRVRVIQEFGRDPVPKEQIYEALNLQVPFSEESSGRKTVSNQVLLTSLRMHSTAFRGNNFSKPAQFLLRRRDDVYMFSAFYCGLDLFSRKVGIPFGFEINGVDWVLFSSFVMMIMLLPSIIIELPISKIILFVLRR